MNVFKEINSPLHNDRVQQSVIHLKPDKHKHFHIFNVICYIVVMLGVAKH